jgi:hypothetical protein
VLQKAYGPGPIREGEEKKIVAALENNLYREKLHQAPPLIFAFPPTLIGNITEKDWHWSSLDVYLSPTQIAIASALRVTPIIGGGIGEYCASISCPNPQYTLSVYDLPTCLAGEERVVHWILTLTYEGTSWIKKGAVVNFIAVSKNPNLKSLSP